MHAVLPLEIEEVFRVSYPTLSHFNTIMKSLYANKSSEQFLEFSTHLHLPSNLIIHVTSLIVSGSYKNPG